MTDHIPAHTVKVCRGAASCPHAVLGQDLSAELEARLLRSGWPSFLAETTRPIRHHHQFKMAVASCPNGCSQPHIADFGLIAFARIGLEPDRCTNCGRCAAVCAENAISFNDSIHLDRVRCLGCAKCARVCPEKALRVDGAEYRVLLGGKLGRHPRLAHELGIYSLPDCLHVLDKVLDVYMKHYRPGLRLGELVERMGRERFDALARP